MRPVQFIGFAIVLLTIAAPLPAQAQEATTLGYQPSSAAARLNVEAARVQAQQDTVTTNEVDPYAVGGNSVVYGAAIGGIIGATAIAINTLSDADRAPVDWSVALVAPIVGGAIGAGVGLLFR